MQIKKNIWFIFYILFFSGFMLYLLLSFLKYEDIKSDYNEKIKYTTQLVSQATSSMLSQYEVMLEVLGEQLQEHDNYKNVEKTSFLLDRMLEKNHSLVGFGLINLQGEFIGTSSNINTSLIPNMISNDKTRYSFNET